MISLSSEVGSGGRDDMREGEGGGRRRRRRNREKEKCDVLKLELKGGWLQQLRSRQGRGEDDVTHLFQLSYERGKGDRMVAPFR
jgi:hypothetical protein